MSKKIELARYSDEPEKFKENQIISKPLQIFSLESDQELENYRFSLIGPQNKTDLNQDP